MANTSLNTAGYWPGLCGLNNTLIVVYDTNLTSDSRLQNLKPARKLDRAYDDNLNLRYILFTTEPDGKITEVGKNGYAEGNFPFITVYPSLNVVIAVNGDYNSNSLYYHVGQLTGTTLKWITPPAGILYIKEGDKPSVSINHDGIVIAAHQKTNLDTGILYCVGYFNMSSGYITWYNSSTDGLCNPQSYAMESGWTPRVQVTNNGRVVIIHLTFNGLFYSIGKLATGNNSITINWVVKEVKYASCSCLHAVLMVDPFGTVMEVHSNKDYDLQYRIGILNDNHIQWKDIVFYGSGFVPVITFLNGTNYLYGEIHSTPNNILQMSTLAFGVELVSITYGTAVPNEKVLFGTKSSEFENNGPGTLGETWKIKSDVSCTNTHTWDVSVHAGISVTAKVNFFFASASATAEESIDLTIGKSYSSTKTFTWEEEEKIIVPPHVGKVSYSAAMFQVPHTIPFVATFKRGPFTWKETGSVYVTHGAIFTYIYASK